MAPDDPSKLFFVTTNRHKFEEAERAFEAAGLEIPLEQASIDAPEIQADRPAQVVEFTRAEVRRDFRGAFFVEDTALTIDALDGFPGIYASYVYGTIGLPGVLALMEGVPEGERTATFESCIAYAPTEGKGKIFRAECPGRVLTEAREGRAFGYDPIFAPAGDDRAFSEIPVEDKNGISHRGQVLDQLVGYLEG